MYLERPYEERSWRCGDWSYDEYCEGWTAICLKSPVNAFKDKIISFQIHWTWDSCKKGRVVSSIRFFEYGVDIGYKIWIKEHYAPYRDELMTRIRCLQYKEELMAKINHPDRLESIAKLCNMDIIDYIDSID